MTATTTQPTESSPLLERALRANVVFSVLSGTGLLLGSPWLADLLGPPNWALAVVGAGVLGFGIAVARGINTDLTSTGRLAMIADLAWVAATIGLAPVVSDFFTTAGGWTAIAVALIVADLAALEWLGLRRTKA